MKKQQLIIEHELKCNSPNIIWDLLSTDSGLTRWIADDVKQQGDKLPFTWGEVWNHHEIRTATIVKNIKLKCIRIKWDDEEGTDSYFELRLEKGHITNDYVLTIIDFAWEDELESIRTIWNDNLTRLRLTCGI